MSYHWTIGAPWGDASSALGVETTIRNHGSALYIGCETHTRPFSVRVRGEPATCRDAVPDRTDDSGH